MHAERRLGEPVELVADAAVAGLAVVAEVGHPEVRPSARSWTDVHVLPVPRRRTEDGDGREEPAIALQREHPGGVAAVVVGPPDPGVGLATGQSGGLDEARGRHRGRGRRLPDRAAAGAGQRCGHGRGGRRPLHGGPGDRRRRRRCRLGAAGGRRRGSRRRHAGHRQRGRGGHDDAGGDGEKARGAGGRGGSAHEAVMVAASYRHDKVRAGGPRPAGGSSPIRHRPARIRHRGCSTPPAPKKI